MSANDDVFSTVPALVGATIADLLTGAHFTAASLAGAGIGVGLDRFLIHSRERARQILLEEIRTGDRPIYDAEEADAFVAVMLRYDRAAIEGRAHWKLRLMARIVDGQLAGRDLKADEFATYADLISSLRREEVIVAATVYRMEKSAGTNRPPNSIAFHEALGRELVPSIFASYDELHATGVALLRTGLLIQLTGYFSDTVGVFATSPLMEQFVRLARLEVSGVPEN